jgi:hypothetical protein
MGVDGVGGVMDEAGRLTYTTNRRGLCAELGSRHGWLLFPLLTRCVDLGV